jgi:hypothetical protein
MAKTKSTIWDNIYLPMLEDSASIQVAIHQITSAYLCSRLDARHTGLLLYAIQIASQNIDRKSFHSKSEIVRSMTVTDEGDELAPEEEVCETGDCAGCDERDTCDDYDPEEENDSDSDEDEEECNSDDDGRDSNEEDEEPAVPSPAPPGIQRLQQAILARLDERTILRLSGGDPDTGAGHAELKPDSEGDRGPQRRVLVAGVEEGGFNPRISPPELTRALAPEEQFALKGHGLSRQETPFDEALYQGTTLVVPQKAHEERALAPEVCLPPTTSENSNLSSSPEIIDSLIIANGEPLPPLRSAFRTG